MNSPWDERYAGDDYVFGTEPNDFLRECAARFSPGSRVLMAAEGEGRNGVWLAAQGHQVSAMDASLEGRRKALALAARAGVELDYELADLASYDFGVGKWDVVGFIFAHTLPEVRLPAWRRAAESLKPGGFVVVECYHPRQLDLNTGGPSDPSRLVALAELQSAFADLEQILGSERLRPVVEGKAHTGEAWVTQFFARRPG